MNEISEGDVEGREPAKLILKQVYSLIGGYSAFQLVNILAFFKCIKRVYCRTYFTFKTGN